MKRYLALFLSLVTVLSLMGTAVGITALADRPDWFTTFGLLSFTLSALTFAHALLRNTFKNPNEGEH